MGFTRCCPRLWTCMLQNPPLVMFSLCLLTICVTYLSFGLLIWIRPVTDADSTEEWDGLLKALSLLMICPSGLLPEQNSFLPIEHLPGKLHNTTLLVRLNINPSDPSILKPAMRISVTATQLGLKGHEMDGNMSITVNPSTDQRNCNDSDCAMKFCVTVIGVHSLLPPKRSSVHCPETGTKDQLSTEAKVWQKGTEIPADCYRIVYNSSTSLDVTLSQEDRTICSTRLFYSVFALFLCGGLLCILGYFCLPPTQDKKSQGLL
ncbi:hypothetical protein GDO86_019353 [Hymenochirus boettgeri]|uniref:Transmembrane protein 248 n=1 Tax=Hymenochirus boettgeri TaxID=247094 RepID=A0A8T2IJ69_9PIPI|nr:hypothetical protein GDO86_019353 [Hymenochirus boettgeri]KAG8431141.1 hypothetical protein GDO86_019353 [Hymenochirus boettgeri]KAG8431142.1 hypothetical protein GDO86_019353 [Hymenochirus boettgeri]KAG8431143.1 hypothetical protein GDO86_019353 [Hymenochirus boettgeri]KAG8431144.1 hypothetical protein GDO86_019353 [Hymenochirus boettgeri]